MAGSAATRFANIPELVGLVVEHVRSTRQLAGLRLASRTFAAAVTPALFSDVCLGRDGAESLRCFAASGLGQHVRRLKIELEGDPDEFDDITDLTEETLLPHMPRLQSFSYVLGQVD